MWENGFKFPTLHWWTLPSTPFLMYKPLQYPSVSLDVTRDSMNVHQWTWTLSFFPQRIFYTWMLKNCIRLSFQSTYFTRYSPQLAAPHAIEKCHSLTKFVPKQANLTVELALGALHLTPAMALSHQGVMGHNCCWTGTKPCFALCYCLDEVLCAGGTWKDTWPNGNSPWAHSIHILFKRASPSTPNPYKDDFCTRHHLMVTD